LINLFFKWKEMPICYTSGNIHDIFHTGCLHSV